MFSVVLAHTMQVLCAIERLLLTSSVITAPCIISITITITFTNNCTQRVVYACPLASYLATKLTYTVIGVLNYRHGFTFLTKCTGAIAVSLTYPGRSYWRPGLHQWAGDQL
jgi:hypothetical protein